MPHGINRRLVFDYQRYLQQPFSIEFSDLKICYDIIVHSAASLVFKCLGIPLLSIISMLDKIQCLSHKVRIEYGDSNLTYGGDTIPEYFNRFIMVLFQGNGFAPQLCSIISSVVFSALCNQGFGIHFVKYFTT